MDTDITTVIANAFQTFLKSNFLYYVKIISAFISVILFIDIILLMNRRIRTDLRISFFGTPAARFKKSKYNPRWEAVKKRLEEKSVASGKLAVIEADKLLGEALDTMKKTGKDTSEKLEAVKPGQMVGLPDVKEAHALVQSVREDPTFEVDLEKIKTAIASYERVFRGIGMID